MLMTEPGKVPPTLAQRENGIDAAHTDSQQRVTVFVARVCKGAVESLDFLVRTFRIPISLIISVAELIRLAAEL